MRCDNAGENKLFQKRSDSIDWKLNVKFEYTVHETPQQNSLADVSVATIGNGRRAMMVGANVPYSKRYKLFREAFTYATMLDWLVIIKIDNKTAARVEHWCGELPS
eukprot:9922277-Ditylum_brightwellii.AAC.1